MNVFMVDFASRPAQRRSARALLAKLAFVAAGLLLAGGYLGLWWAAAILEHVRR